MIACSPFPAAGFAETHKFQAKDLFEMAEKHRPGFCAKHGVPMDGKYLALGKIKHQALIEKCWHDFPVEAKEEFLKAQFDGAVYYLIGCAQAYKSAGCATPQDVKDAVDRLLDLKRD